MNKINRLIYLLLLSFFLIHTAQGAWVDSSSSVNITQTRQMFDRTNKVLFSYVTLENVSNKSLEAPLRLIILNPSIPTVNADGITIDAQDYFLINEPILAGEKKKIRVDFRLTRKRIALVFNTKLEQDDGIRINRSPTANAGNDFTAKPDTAFFLDGRGSVDLDDDNLLFSWTIKTSPDSSNVDVVTPSAVVTQFKADAEGAYTFLLSVNDGKETSTDEVTVFLDLDGDGAIGQEDKDRDGDNVLNKDDAFPDNPTEFVDSDGNGIGNFAQQDEDNDSILDRNDLFPFDPLQNDYQETMETEFNDNPGDANDTGQTYPFRVLGSIDHDIDGDYFKFSASSGDLVTATLYKSSDVFQPSLTISDLNGRPLQAVKPNYDEGRPFDIAITVSIPSNGQYLLIINDLNSSGEIGFDYVTEVFQDADIDALDDNRELALGINPFSSDSDSDKIFDSSEAPITLINPGVLLLMGSHITNQDIDQDGRPNWFDLDTDNDFILDSLEGASDLDKDGIPNFADNDADGNGISDTEEAGINPALPVDTDLDGQKDFIDLDDDQDGILDIFDDNRLVAVVAADPLDLSERIIIRDTYALIDNQQVSGVARIGDTLLIEGTGFSAVKEENLIIFYQEDGSIANVVPITATENSLEVVMPDILVRDVAVMTRNKVSNREPLTLLNLDAPVLFFPDITIAGINENLVLTGLNLQGPINISFNGVLTQATSLPDGSSVEVIVPINAGSGVIIAVTSSGISNEIPFTIEKEVPGHVDISVLPSVNPESLTIDNGILHVTVPDLNGEFITKLDASNPALVFAYLPETTNKPLTVLFEYYGLPTDTDVQLSFLSTGVSRLMTVLFVAERVTIDRLEDVREMLSLLPETQRLAEKMEEEAVIDPYFQKEPLDGDLLIAWTNAVKAANQALLDFAAGDELFALADVIAQAIITPEEQFDVKVNQRDEPNSGNIQVENDTTLFMSTKIVDKESGAVLQSHITGPYDRNIVAPQGLGLFFNAAMQDYDQPNYRDADIEVLTAGIARPLILGPTTRCLQIRSFVDGMALPILSKLIGVSLQGKDLWNILNSLSPTIISEIFTDYTEGNIKGATDRFFGLLMDDFLKPGFGPITRAIVKKAVGPKAFEQALIKIAARFGARFIPYVGWAITAFDVVDVGLPIIKYQKDILLTPSKLNFLVDFTLGVKNVTPLSMRKSEKDIEITIKGTGFLPFIEGFFTKTTTYPEVVFIDEATNKQVKVTGNPNASGTEMTAKIPGSFRKQVEGPIRVEVSHGGDNKSADNKIEVVSLKIDSLTPDTGGAGTVVKIQGAGFSSNEAENSVTFESVSGRFPSLIILSATESELIVLAPPGVETGDVTVEIDSETSNGVVFTVDRTKVVIAFGDNGAANDDTFALFVDGDLVRSMASPSRRVIAELELEQGTHNVKLRGITAPDFIGTYYINFEQGVGNVTGAPLSGSDLTAGVEKNYVIEVIGSQNDILQSNTNILEDMILQDE